MEDSFAVGPNSGRQSYFLLRLAGDDRHHPRTTENALLRVVHSSHLTQLSSSILISEETQSKENVTRRDAQGRTATLEGHPAQREAA